MRFFKYLFLISCVIFAFLLIGVQPVPRNYKYSFDHRSGKFNNESIKFILLWAHPDLAPFNFLKEGQESFFKANCSVNNCYVTSNRTFLGPDYITFDAIAFNGREMELDDLPEKRSDHQKYIYFNMESADNFPVCDPEFDGFFNWTATYKLNSDIPMPYFLIKDTYGAIIGPKPDIPWKEDMEEVGDKYLDLVRNKTKTAAWFVSNCKARSNRGGFVNDLQDALRLIGDHTIDVYGKCGNLTCDRKQYAVCDSLLEKDYFFYMSLENSFSEDYVTEKLAKALKLDIVPIVYGGAEYSRFLPPGSYIDSRQYKIEELAAILDKLIHTPEEYSQYFRWKQYYTYHDPLRFNNICRICEALNDENLMMENSVYEDFRAWWHPDYLNRCFS